MLINSFYVLSNDTGTLGSVSITFTLVTPQNVGDVTLTGTQTLDKQNFNCSSY